MLLFSFTHLLLLSRSSDPPAKEVNKGVKNSCPLETFVWWRETKDQEVEEATKAKGKTKAALEAGRKGVGEVADVSL